VYGGKGRPKLEALLERGKGISASDAAGLRGWQKHTVLGFARGPVSLHEAGHAVAMCVLGVPFDWASAVADLSEDRFGGVVHTNGVPDTEEYVIALYAGVEAERRWYIDPESHEDIFRAEKDFLKARAVVARMLGSTTERKLHNKLRKLRLQARDLVNRPNASRAIDAVAERLAKGQRLSRRTGVSTGRDCLRRFSSSWWFASIRPPTFEQLGPVLGGDEGLPVLEEPDIRSRGGQVGADPSTIPNNRSGSSAAPRPGCPRARPGAPSAAVRRRACREPRCSRTRPSGILVGTR
jgi:hypothetical protein